MQTRKLITLLLLLTAGLLVSCGSDDPPASGSETANSESPEDLNATMEEAMSDAMKQMGGDGEAREVVDFRKLKELLPESVAGIARTSHNGEKVGAMGFKMSTAEAKYEGEEGQALEVSIIDFAGVAMVLSSAAAWSSVEIDKETDTGYERTTMIDGYKAFEEYDGKRKEGQVSIIVGDRYIVTIEGRNIEESTLKAALGQVDVDALAGLE